MAKVTLSNVGKVFPGNVRAVRDFSLEIPDGQFVVLVGPSGCGKTTMLRLVAGLEQACSGTITIDGRDVLSVPPKDRDVAMVFQSDALYPHMTVYDNMAFALKLRKVGKGEIKGRVTEAADVLGLSALLNRRPHQLSGGQRQRVALGRAMVRRPKVFLLDEPLSHLDAKMRVQMRLEIKQLHHRRLQQTMIYVTHDQTEAMTMGDRIVVMNDGLIQQVAEPNPLYDRPANLFVAGFIGTPPMNLLSGRIRCEQGRFRFEGESFQVPLPAAWHHRLVDLTDRPVVFGIRPEDVFARDLGTNSPRVTATIDMVEPLGSETHVHVSRGETRIVCRAGRQGDFQPGSPMELAINMEKAHLFDPDTQRALI